MKKLIVLATLAALPAVAMADVTISGDIAVGLTSTKTQDVGSVNDMSRNSGQIVFKGNEDLGNGLKAIWQVANRIDPTGDESGEKAQWANRDTFVGLSGAFGSIKFGNVSNPTNSGYSGDADVFSQIGLHGDGSYKDGEARLKHSVRFDSAPVAGFSVAVSQQIKESTANTNTQPAYAGGVGVKYKTDAFTAQYSLATNKNGSVKGKTDKFNQFTVLVPIADIGLNFGYGDSTKYSATGKTKKAGYGVSATYALGNITPAIGLWKQLDSKVDGAKVNDDFNVVSLAVDYALSKRTNAGVEFQHQSEGLVGAKDKKRIAAVYIGHKF